MSRFLFFALEPKKMCDFKQMEGKILKTVDSVYQNVKNLSECQQMCLNGPYRCRSYDFGDPSNPVCRTSHLDKLSLSHVENPYIEIGGAVTYELQNCYDGKRICANIKMTFWPFFFFQLLSSVEPRRWSPRYAPRGYSMEKCMRNTSHTTVWPMWPIA